ncbi:hypothetical protein CRG98_050200 [Punica granatum]|uniref:Uncharacterized protein n=1 Tax=Punica granatum TaxID=22663 RepID=A0A2I0GK66_PUNGR|nr:hypothetical protein CRG98_050200 [Punica granatum]
MWANPIVLDLTREASKPEKPPDPRSHSGQVIGLGHVRWMRIGPLKAEEVMKSISHAQSD